MKRLYVMMSLMLCLNVAQAASNQEVYATMQALKLERKQERPVVSDDAERVRIVKHWAKALSKLDDHGLGDAQLQKKDMQMLEALKHDVQVLTKTYYQKVKPIFLNNLKLGRNDSVTRLNHASLSELFFPTKYNHKTKKPITGILYYQQDIDDSFFSKELVDAGLLLNFPELKEADWIKDARAMELELIGFFNIHRERFDGVKFVKPKTKAERQSKVVVSASHVPDGLHQWSPSKREKVVRKFVRSLQKLDDTQSVEAFKQGLQALLETYEYSVKPILVDNVNQQRVDIGARANKGDLLGLFMKNKYNHKTGKPISGKLEYKKSVGGLFSDETEDAGYLVDDVSLKDDVVIKQALAMEEALHALLKEHEAYLKFDNSVMY